MKFLKLVNITILILFILSCNKEANNLTAITNDANSVARISASFLEDFETGTKSNYSAANVTLATGVWNFNDALLGTSSGDAKHGLQSARVRNSGKITMKFNHTAGASIVTVKHAKYGSDANGTWQLWYSTNNGTSYTLASSTINTSTTALQTASFTINIAGNIRFEIRKTDAGSNRLNFDDFSITDYSGTVNPIPVLSSISPSSDTADSATFTMSVTGSNFINGSVVNWNGAPLTTTFTSGTQLSANVPATDVVSAGTASVTVFNPAPGGGTSGSQTFTINNVSGNGAKKFLFDATKAETAGNADWVVDEDNNTPHRIPTPTQSNITSSTSETYWTGAISSWGIALVKAGNTVETLPSGTAITYGNSSNSQDLSNYDVFVVDEPNIVFTSAEKTAIINFVNNGGGLFMVSDHTQSDRNNDGWDSPDIWNDLMTNNSVQNNPFGFSIDLTNISEVSNNILSNSSSSVILNGSQGSVSQLEFNNGATITTNSAANPNVQGLIWENTYSQTSTHVMCASSTYGTGRVFAVTDSSPMDDGTGASGNNLFVSWSIYSHAHLFMNASLWLAKMQ
jgi:hypothetical protein